MDLFKMFDTVKNNSIMLDFKTEHKEKLPIGTSKFGGKPDVPKDFNRRGGILTSSYRWEMDSPCYFRFDT